MLKIARVYEPKTDSSKRVLVDRLWPRGLTKEAAAIDEWLKNLAPSNELRQWYGHEPEKYLEFKRRYLKELSPPEKQSLLQQLVTLAEESDVTLVYSAKNTEINNAVVLAELINKLMNQRRTLDNKYRKER